MSQNVSENEVRKQQNDEINVQNDDQNNDLNNTWNNHQKNDLNNAQGNSQKNDLNNAAQDDGQHNDPNNHNNSLALICVGFVVMLMALGFGIGLMAAIVAIAYHIYL